jgi:HPr kinase/phosphorylase
MTARQLLADEGPDLRLRILAGEAGLDRRHIVAAEINRPSLALAGFTHRFAFERVQVLGITECEYLERAERQLRARRVARLFEFDMPCLVATSGRQPLPMLLECAEKAAIPVFGTPLLTADFCKRLGARLELVFAPRTQMHAGLVEVFGMGVILVGRSGVGKSECALELIERGHRLVADDVVVLRRLPLDRIVGASNAMLRHHLELRGLGIVDVESIFGVGAVRDSADVDLVVELEKWVETKQYERLGVETHTTPILGVDIPQYTIPIEPGRSTSILVEVAALIQRLKNTGRNPADLFEKEVLARMRGASVKPVPRPFRDYPPLFELGLLAPRPNPDKPKPPPEV